MYIFSTLMISQTFVKITVFGCPRLLDQILAYFIILILFINVHNKSHVPKVDICNDVTSQGIIIDINIKLCWLLILSGESCLVESHRCSFPFNSGSPESNHYSCQPSNRTDGSTEHFCYSQVTQTLNLISYSHSNYLYLSPQIGNRHVYGVCSSECYQTDGGW